ncbi:MAG: CHAD domain-containing protein [Acidobacteria bacterium]|nr:CHAD domain-containing protein [Acidobacteriota bacterium]
MALNPKRVAKPFRKLRKLLKSMPKQPVPDQVHDLRTNTRALEAMAAALSLHSQSQVRKLLKDLTRIRKRAGKVRDLDVLSSYAVTVHANGEQDCSVRLLEQLGAKRRKKARKLHAIVAKHGAATRHELKQTSTLFEDELCQTEDSTRDPQDAQGRVIASALKLQKELTEPARLNRRNLHPYRLKVKQLRNVLRMAQDENPNQDFVVVLGEVKDAIGEWHDWEALLLIAREVLEHGARCKLLRQLKRTCEEKYQDALRKSEGMRRRYFRVAGGTNTHRLKPSEPVWTATTAIAA